MRKKTIHAALKPSKLIAMQAEVKITAAADGEDGKPKGPPTFDVVAYTGGAMNLRYWDYPVVVDLAGLTFGKSLVANLDHDASKRVGHVTGKSKADGQLILSGVVSAATEAAREVVESSANGFVWQASIEANPDQLLEVKAGKTIKVNGTEFQGPIFVARKSTLKGFAFVSHGADDNTSVSIAATAASKKENAMKAEVKAWAEQMLPGLDVDTLTAEQAAGLEANYAGQHGKKPAIVATDNPFEARKVEAKRRNDIREIADKFIERRDGDLEYIEAVEKMHDHAVQAKMNAQEFRNEMYESMVPLAHTVPTPRTRDRSAGKKVLEAALCQAGRLNKIENHFDAQTLDAADREFRDGIGLTQLFCLCAEANGYRGSHGGRVTLDVQRAAFGMTGPQQIRAQGWSTIEISTIISNTANKFLREGWMAVDQTAMRIAAVRPVRNFQEITTVSLTGDLLFEKLGAAGEIKHGTLGELNYGNKADTYAKLLAITRQDLINDDLGALTSVPRRLGRGGMLMLNHIFWTEFLNPSVVNFFHTDNANVSTADGTLGLTGLSQAEVIFMDQTDPNGKPLALEPKILLVPTPLKTTAMQLMGSEFLIGASGTVTPGSNPYRNRFRVESSPYLSNSAYSGYSAVAWYLLADPSDLPMIEIVALNGRVEPVIETADADFNSLGVQMRGYSDVGVRVQEPRAAVRADGSGA